MIDASIEIEKALFDYRKRGKLTNFKSLGQVARRKENGSYYTAIAYILETNSSAKVITFDTWDIKRFHITEYRSEAMKTIATAIEELNE